MPAIAKLVRKVSLNTKTQPAPLLATTPTLDSLIADPSDPCSVFKTLFPPLSPSEPGSLSHSQASYLSRIVPRKECDQTIKEAVKLLKQVDFDTIAVRGVSGMLIGPILAYRLKKELFVVRKPEDTSTAGRLYEGHVNIMRYIIADDLISTGSTGVHIIRLINEVAPGAKLVGVLLYATENAITTFDGENDFKTTHLLTKAATPTFRPS